MKTEIDSVTRKTFYKSSTHGVLFSAFVSYVTVLASGDRKVQ